MISGKYLEKLFGGRLQEAHTNNQSVGSARLAALREFHDMLGLETHPTRGVPMVPLDERGLPVLKSGRCNPNEISLRALAEAIHGREFTDEYYHPNSGFDFGLLREAAIDPSAFTNINAFNLGVAGLLNAEIMERFNAPQYIGRNLVTIKATKSNGQKLIAVARMSPTSKTAKGRLPGEAHTEVGFSEAYQTTPETVEQAEKCRVTKEAVFFDLTGQVLEEADAVGDDLGYGMEKDIADTVLGVTGLPSRYNRNGTSSETYQTATPWINDHSNPFTDAQDVDDARQLFIGMTDPESDREIQVVGNNILCMPAKELLMRHQIFASNMQVGSQGVTGNLGGNFPTLWSQGGNILNGTGPYTIQALSAIWYNRATAADGLNLAATDAQKYWYIGDFNKAFWWMENWPLTPWMANADELRMKDEGLVAVYGANYRGQTYTREPRYVVRNKN